MQKINQNEFRIERVINRKEKQLYVKWKGYYSSFNILIVGLKCAVCSNKKPRFMKEQGGKRLVSTLGLKASLYNIPLLGDILF